MEYISHVVDRGLVMKKGGRGWSVDESIGSGASS